jgi:hypothetical protein
MPRRRTFHGFHELKIPRLAWTGSRYLRHSAGNFAMFAAYGAPRQRTRVNRGNLQGARSRGGGVKVRGSGFLANERLETSQGLRKSRQAISNN